MNHLLHLVSSGGVIGTRRIQSQNVAASIATVSE